MRPILAPLAAMLLLAACHEQTPAEKQADQIRDAADAQAAALQADAGNQAAAMQSQAEELLNQAGQQGGYESEKLKIRAQAMKDEAAVIEKQAAARARAIRDEGRAKASALLAQ